jgi:hypothetical protein
MYVGEEMLFNRRSVASHFDGDKIFALVLNAKAPERFRDLKGEISLTPGRSD